MRDQIMDGAAADPAAIDDDWAAPDASALAPVVAPADDPLASSLADEGAPPDAPAATAGEAPVPGPDATAPEVAALQPVDASAAATLEDLALGDGAASPARAPAAAASGGLAEQILADRPDVLRGFFEAYYGPNNDHHSDAWTDRVGGATPEAYALYWYKTHGQYEGYVPSGGAGAAAPLEDAGGGRTTDDGVSLAQILRDRPDVYQAFFTEYEGPHNDHHSSAWVDRVGGATPEDYANYWYQTYGRWEGYQPSTTAAPTGDPEPAPDPVPPAPDDGAGETAGAPPPDDGGEPPIIVVGQALTGADPFAG